RRPRANLALGAAGPGGPAGLQNRSGVAAPRWVGSTPAPLRTQPKLLHSSGFSYRLGYRPRCRLWRRISVLVPVFGTGIAPESLFEAICLLPERLPGEVDVALRRRERRVLRPRHERGRWRSCGGGVRDRGVPEVVERPNVVGDQRRPERLRVSPHVERRPAGGEAEHPNTRSSPAGYAVRALCSNYSEAIRSPSAIVRSPACDSGVSCPYLTHVSETRRYAPSGVGQAAHDRQSFSCWFGESGKSMLTVSSPRRSSTLPRWVSARLSAWVAGC